MANGEKKQGLKWFAFYVYARPILGLLFSLQFLSIFFDNFSSLAYYSQIYGIGNIILLLATIIMLMLALCKSKYLIKIIPIILIYETFFMPLGSAINEQYSNTESVEIYFALLVVCILCWLIPNYIYFRKRKWVFQDDKDVVECKHCKNNVLKTEDKCPCCKHQLLSKNDKTEEIFICDNCGSKVKESDTKCPNCGLKFVESSEEKKQKEKPKVETKEEFVCDNCGSNVKVTDKYCPKCLSIFEEDKDNTIKKDNKSGQKKEEDKTNIDKMYNDLTKLKKLLDKEIITKEEFEKEKKKILKD